MSRAGFVTYTNTTVDTGGTGFGNILQVLVLSDSPTETGSVLTAVSPATGDVRTGDATTLSRTYSVTELAAAGIGGTEFSLIFNINEPGSANEPNGPLLTLNDFELVFQNSAGGVLFLATFASGVDGLTLSQVDQGQGNSGFLFNVDLSVAESNQFFGNGTNRLGLRTTEALSGTAGGAENFYVASSSVGATAVAPEPASLVMGAIGIGMFGMRSLLRRRKVAA